MTKFRAPRTDKLEGRVPNEERFRGFVSGASADVATGLSQIAQSLSGLKPPSFDFGRNVRPILVQAVTDSLPGVEADVNYMPMANSSFRLVNTSTLDDKSIEAQVVRKVQKKSRVSGPNTPVSLFIPILTPPSLPPIDLDGLADDFNRARWNNSLNPNIPDDLYDPINPNVVIIDHPNYDVTLRFERAGRDDTDQWRPYYYTPIHERRKSFGGAKDSPPFGPYEPPPPGIQFYEWQETTEFDWVKDKPDVPGPPDIGQLVDVDWGHIQIRNAYVYGVINLASETGGLLELGRWSVIANTTFPSIGPPVSLEMLAFPDNTFSPPFTMDVGPEWQYVSLFKPLDLLFQAGQQELISTFLIWPKDLY